MGAMHHIGKVLVARGDVTAGEWQEARKAGPTGVRSLVGRLQSNKSKEQKKSGYSTYSAGGGKTSTLG